jgi:ABC-2 type transport system permease protein
MLKMLKYEFRRGIFPLLIVGIVIAAIELYFLISTLTAHADHSVIAVSLLILAAYLFVLIYGIISYSQDLKNKSGYLVFMAPISSYKVIGAKLLSILLTGAIIVAVIFGLLTLDLSLAYSTYDSIDTFYDFLSNILEMGGYSLGGVILRLLAFILVFLIQFFMTITLAYLAVSVCSTILQTKKIKGFISFVLFIVFYVILSVIASKIPHLSNPGPNATFMEAMYAMIPQIALYFVVMVASYIGSSVLLEKKISL